MIIYEVNCLVDNGIVDEFREWLKPHVDAVLKGRYRHPSHPKGLVYIFEHPPENVVSKKK